jgi:hypothetical protein
MGDKPEDDKPDKPETGEGPEPDWKAEAEKWKELARKHEARAKENADAAKTLKDVKDQSKSEIERLAEAVRESTKRQEETERRAIRAEVAQAKGLTAQQARRLVGETREEMEADAADLLAAFTPAKKEGDGDGEQKPPGSRQEKLRGGGEPDSTPAEMDPRKLAKIIAG